MIKKKIFTPQEAPPSLPPHVPSGPQERELKTRVGMSSLWERFYSFRFAVVTTCLGKTIDFTDLCGRLRIWL